MASSDPNLYAFELIFKGLSDSKTPVSKSKIQSITEHAIKAQKYYKHVVMQIEAFIRKSSPKHKLPGIYVIDSILRISRRKGKERDVFAARFAKNLGVTFTFAAKCVEEDKFKVFRCFKLWKEGHFFPNEMIDPIVQKISAVESFENITEAPHDEADQHDTENDANLDLSKTSPIPQREADDRHNLTKSDSPKISKAEKVRFDKRLLDFDYSDEEEGDGVQRGGKRNRKRPEKEEEDYFTFGKDGKPEFAIDKIMSGLRQSRATQPLAMHLMASPEPPSLEVTDENNEMELSSPGPTDSVDVPTVNADPVLDKPIILKSCTVWIGHLPKGTSEGELKKAMSEYGGVSTLDLISSRGCAYVSYEKRRHAESAVRSRRDLWKLFGDKVKISWGPGRGIKAGYKEWNWDAETGICEIKPSLLPVACKDLAEGCELVLESVPDSFKARFSDQPDLSLNGSQAAAVSLNGTSSSTWEKPAAGGFTPLETHIKTWDALLQSQSHVEAVLAPPSLPLPLAFDVLQPPNTFPSFFTGPPSMQPLSGSMNSTGSSSPSKQSGLAIPTITGQTSWTDPVTPKSSLFSKMKAAEEFADPFSNLSHADNDPSPILNTNSLFTKPPPPLGALQFPNQSGPPPLNPGVFFANLANSPFLANTRLPFGLGGSQSFVDQSQGNSPATDRGVPPPLPIFRGLGSSGLRSIGGESGSFHGMDVLNLQSNGLGNRFPDMEMILQSNANGLRNLATRFGGGNQDIGNRFAGSDIRLPSNLGAMGNQFNGVQLRPPFGQNNNRLPSWSNMVPSRLDGDFVPDRDRRNNFHDDQRNSNSFQNNGHRQNFHNNGGQQTFQNSHDNNHRNFQNNSNNFDSRRRFDGPDNFPERSFQQRTPR